MLQCALPTAGCIVCALHLIIQRICPSRRISLIPEIMNAQPCDQMSHIHQHFMRSSAHHCISEQSILFFMKCSINFAYGIGYMSCLDDSVLEGELLYFVAFSPSSQSLVSAQTRYCHSEPASGLQKNIRRQDDLFVSNYARRWPLVTWPVQLTTKCYAPSCRPPSVSQNVICIPLNLLLLIVQSCPQPFACLWYPYDLTILVQLHQTVMDAQISCESTYHPSGHVMSQSS